MKPVSIESIIENGTEEVWDISMLGDEEFLNDEPNFIAQNIVVHNCHAAGLVVSPVPLSEICPLHYTQDTLEVLGEDESSEKKIATQWSMADVESMGLIKFDILGLSTKTAISWAVETIWNNHHVNVDIRSLPLDDKETVALIRSGRTAGCFQLEGSGMQDAIKQINVANFTDLVITIAMYRPGPMDYIPELASRKAGKTKISYDHPLMASITKPTYGIICFQEQLMKAFMSLAGLTASDGYDFMKGCAKKIVATIEQYKIKFLEGCKKNDIDEKVANKVWADMEKFGGYAFNRAHAVSYAYECWKTAYLKAHYPTEFIEARLSVENMRRRFDLVAKYEMDATRNYGVKILPPDINKSKVRYTIEGNLLIRKPLLLKGIGKKAATDIMEHQPYSPVDPLESFGMRVGKNVNSKVVEAMWEAKLWPTYKKAELLRLFEQLKKDKKASAGTQTDDLFA